MKKENPEHSEEHKKTKNKEMVDLNEVEQVENLRDESVFVMVQPRIGPKKKETLNNRSKVSLKCATKQRKGMSYFCYLKPTIAYFCSSTYHHSDFYEEGTLNNQSEKQ